MLLSISTNPFFLSNPDATHLVCLHSAMIHIGDTPVTVALRMKHQDVVRFFEQFISFAPKEFRKTVADFEKEVRFLFLSLFPSSSDDQF